MPLVSQRVSEMIKSLKGKDFFVKINAGDDTEIRANIINLKIKESRKDNVITISDKGNLFEFEISLNDVTNYLSKYNMDSDNCERLDLKFQSGATLHFEIPLENSNDILEPMDSEEPDLRALGLFSDDD